MKVLLQNQILHYNLSVSIILYLQASYMKHNSSPFKWRHYEPEFILLCIR